MKTIKQIADEIGVSKQAVQKRIAREPLYTCIHPHVYSEKGTRYLNEPGEILIKRAFNKDLSTIATIYKGIDKNGLSIPLYIDKNSKKQPKVHNNLQDEIIKILQETVEILQKQLEIKDKQIEELTLTVKIQAESINYDRKNEFAETLVDGQQKLIEKENQIKQSANFFKRLFRKK